MHCHASLSGLTTDDDGDGMETKLSQTPRRIRNSPFVFSLVACSSGCTVGPFPRACIPSALCVVVVVVDVVVVLVGVLVGYFLAALPAAFAPFEAVEPML